MLYFILVEEWCGVRIFKTKSFVRYARQERIGDHSLREAIERAGGLSRMSLQPSACISHHQPSKELSHVTQ
ncbi:MAG: type II toxin-antitoxin system RelE/ParE family toxin [Syntrophobacteraceae bacterium]